LAVFEVSLTDGVSAPAKKAGGAVSSLASEFDSLQKSMAAEKSAVSSALAKELAEKKSIAAEQQKNLGGYDKARDTGAAKEAATIAAEQKANMAAYADAAEAAHGRATHAIEKEKAALAGLAAEQQANMAAYAQAADAMAAREKAQMASIAAEQKKALDGHRQDADAAQGLKEQREESEGVAREFKALTASGDSAAESLEGVRRMAESAAEAFAIGAVIVAAYATVLGEAASMAVRLTQEKDQLRATFDALNGAGTGGALLDELEDLAAQLPFTGDKLNAWAKGLLSAGIKGDALQTSIKAIAAATAIMQEGGGVAAEGLIKRFALAAETGAKITIDKKILKQLSEAGVLAGDLAKQLGVAPEKLTGMTVGADKLGSAMQQALIVKGAGPLKALGNTWGTISAKLNEGFEDAFEDLGELVRPFMAEMQSLASEFYAGSAAGEDWKSAIKGALTGAFEVATNFVHFIHRGFLEAQVAVLQFRLALKPVTSLLGQLGAGSAAVNVALYVLKGTCIAIAIVLGVVAVAVGLIAAPFLMVGAAILFVVDTLDDAIAHFDDLKTGVSDAGASVLSSVSSFVTGAVSFLLMLPIEAAKAGANFVLGLVQAIAGGSGAVAGAVKGLAMSAVNTITGALQIRSPSRVMMRVGGYVSEGLAQGISGGVPDVTASARSAGMATIDGVQGGVGAGGSSGSTLGQQDGKGSGRQIVIMPGAFAAGAFVLSGSGSVLEVTEEAMAQVLERLAAITGN
jgi:hypothetical protein